MKIAIGGRAGSLLTLMKIWAAFVSIPILLLVGACEKHPVSDLSKIDPSALTSPSPAP